MSINFMNTRDKISLVAGAVLLVWNITLTQHVIALQKLALMEVELVHNVVKLVDVVQSDGMKNTQMIREYLAHETSPVNSGPVSIQLLHDPAYYCATVTYFVGDECSSNDITWVAKKDSVGNQPEDKSLFWKRKVE